MKNNQIDLMSICKKDKFIVTGLDDMCYMLVDTVEFTAMNIPLFLKGEMFQIDNETGESHNLGRRELQVNIETDGYWPVDDKE